MGKLPKLAGRDYADALDDLLSALGIDVFDIVANSFGTRVAQCFAYHRPGRIGRAVFTGTSIPHSTSREERARSIENAAATVSEHSLPGGRYPLPGPDFHRLDRASFAWRTATRFT